MPDGLHPTFIAPDGTRYPLVAELPVGGRYGPPIEIIEGPPSASDDGAGATVRKVRHGPRDLLFVLFADPAQSDAATVHDRLRELVAALDPIRGAGTIEWPAPDDTVRQINCHLSQGLEYEETVASGASIGDHAKSGVVFRASDPYWRDTDPVTATFDEGDRALWLPLPPLEPSADDVFAAPTITNDGDVKAWPIWTVVGPSTEVTLRNVTAGEELVVDVALAAGEELTIDTRPRRKTVTDAAGANRFADLSDDSWLWALARGDNDVQVQIVDSSSASEV